MQEGFTAIKMSFNKSSNEGFEVTENVKVVGSATVMIDSLRAFKLHEAKKVAQARRIRQYRLVRRRSYAGRYHRLSHASKRWTQPSEREKAMSTDSNSATSS